MMSNRRTAVKPALVFVCSNKERFLAILFELAQATRPTSTSVPFGTMTCSVAGRLWVTLVSSRRSFRSYPNTNSSATNPEFGLLSSRLSGEESPGFERKFGVSISVHGSIMYMALCGDALTCVFVDWKYNFPGLHKMKNWNVRRLSCSGVKIINDKMATRKDRRSGSLNIAHSVFHEIFQTTWPKAHLRIHEK